VVPDLHFERPARFLRDSKPDFAEPDDAEDAVVGVVRRGGDVLIRVVELCRGTGAGGEEGPGDCAVGGKDEDDGDVGDGLGASRGGVAVDDTYVEEFNGEIWIMRIL
jgi:hypothetical protein